MGALGSPLVEEMIRFVEGSERGFAHAAGDDTDEP
jgi:hypothetical protein